MSNLMPQEFVLHSPIRVGQWDVTGSHPHFDVGQFGTQNRTQVIEQRASTGANPQASTRASTQTNTRASTPGSVRAAAISNPEWNAEQLLILLGGMLHGPDLLQSMHSAATWIRKELDASYVLLAGSKDGMNLHHSLQCGLSAQMELVELRDAIHAALQETILTGRKHFGYVGPSEQVAKQNDCGRAIQLLAQKLPGCESITALPLITSQGRTVGSIVVAWPPAVLPERPSVVDRFECLTTAIADVLQLQQKSPESIYCKVSQAIRRRISQNRLLWICLLLTLLVGIGLIPTPYPVRAKVTVEPDSRRWIAAPFDAPLKKSNVVPGQQVAIGDLLYSIDCQDLLNKLASLKADADKFAAERVTHLSAGRLADAAIAGASLKRAQVEVDLIYRYLDRAEVRSPVDGVVMGQDLKRLEGSPLTQGQAMLEIAPLNLLYLKAEIPTDLISEVVIGNSASVSLEAIGDLGPTKLVRFQPRAEPNEQGRYVFEGRIDLSEQVSGMMPGMSGYATLHGEFKPLAWCLFQRLWQRLRSWSDQL